MPSRFQHVSPARARGCVTPIQTLNCSQTFQPPTHAMLQGPPVSSIQQSCETNSITAASLQKLLWNPIRHPASAHLWLEGCMPSTNSCCEAWRGSGHRKAQGLACSLTTANETALHHCCYTGRPAQFSLYMDGQDSGAITFSARASGTNITCQPHADPSAPGTPGSYTPSRRPEVITLLPFTGWSAGALKLSHYVTLTNILKV